MYITYNIISKKLRKEKKKEKAVFYEDYHVVILIRQKRNWVPIPY